MASYYYFLDFPNEIYSGETLRDMENPENVLVISTWKSTEGWRAWSHDKQRTEIVEKIDATLGQRTEYNIYQSTPLPHTTLSCGEVFPCPSPYLFPTRS